MVTLRLCLESLPGDLVMLDLAAVRTEVAPVSDHLARLRREDEGYEVRFIDPEFRTDKAH